MGISTRATDSLRILADQSRSKMEIGGPSWKDIFDSSDIGAERNMIARRFVTEDVAVLDAGCGRGYFSFACAWKA